MLFRNSYFVVMCDSVSHYHCHDREHLEFQVTLTTTLKLRNDTKTSTETLADSLKFQHLSVVQLLLFDAL